MENMLLDEQISGWIMEGIPVGHHYHRGRHPISDESVFKKRSFVFEWRRWVGWEVSRLWKCPHCEIDNHAMAIPTDESDNSER